MEKDAESNETSEHLKDDYCEDCLGCPVNCSDVELQWVGVLVAQPGDPVVRVLVVVCCGNGPETRNDVDNHKGNKERLD